MKTKICCLHAQNDLRVEEGPVTEPGPTDVVVAIERGGICGSDLHYYRNGGIGSIRVVEPIIMGHEISGRITRVGENAGNLDLGDKVAVNPSHPCFSCHHCDEGQFQHCVDMRFLGSARTIPHVQGGFRNFITIDQRQCHKVEEAVGFGEAACAEPLAVCLHAKAQAGDLHKKRVLITGAGPIGVLCAAIAKQSGASGIVVTDLSAFTLSIAQKMGASKIINVMEDTSGLEKEVSENGMFDVVFECSAAPPAIHSAINAIRPRGTIVQIGVAGNLEIPFNMLVGKEIVFKGSHRFHPEFADAVEWINKRTIDVTPLITQTRHLDDAVAAFDLAGDRSRAMKVQLQFDHAV